MADEFEQPADDDQPRYALAAALRALRNQGDDANAEVILAILNQRAAEGQEEGDMVYGAFFTDEMAFVLYG